MYLCAPEKEKNRPCQKQQTKEQRLYRRFQNCGADWMTNSTASCRSV